MEEKNKIDWEELETDLKTFDYTYIMSDDFRVWKVGEKKEKEIKEKLKKAIEENKEKVKSLIEKYKSKYGTQFLNNGGNNDY